MDLLLDLNWLAVGEIILIDMLLGGDNAIVIALACRNLSPRSRIRGIFWGSAGAVVVRIVLIVFAVHLLQLPYVKLAGGLLLFAIGVQLLAENDNGMREVHGSERLLAAVGTIIVADLVMSIDNVVAIASAAEQAPGGHHILLVGFGIVVSIPIIVWGSTLILRLIDRFPVIVTGGSALLGYLAGEMIVDDPAVHAWAAGFPSMFSLRALVDSPVNLPGVVGAILAVVIGRALKRRGA